MKVYRFFDTNITVTESLKKFIKIEREFKEQIKETTKAFEENVRFYDSSLNQLCRVRSRINSYIDILIQKIENEYNYYDCTFSDFSKDSSYSELMRITKEFDAFSELLKTKKNVVISAKLEQAAKEANAKITGLRFGIITSSIAEHLLYELQNQLAIKQQASEAEKYYKDAENRINSQVEQQISLESRKYYNQIYAPKMKVAIQEAYTGVMFCYLRLLNDIGEINIDDISEYSLDRSQQILKNISSATDKNKVLEKALEICPYNINLYVEANKLGLYWANKSNPYASLQGLAVMLGIWREVETNINPEVLDNDQLIEKELDRLIENEIDTSDDNWKMRADTYMREAQRLIEKYPSSFSGYGLTAAFLIAKNYSNRYGGFWDEFKKNVAKFLDSYTGEEGYAYHFDDILMLIHSSLGSYFREADEFLKNNWHNDSEQAMWHSVASIKRSLIPAIDGVQYFIQCMESSEKVTSHWSERQKNDLLWFVYRFCAPHIIYKSIDNSIAIRYHIPLCERKFAIDIYDSLIAQGVDKYESGHYAFEKKYNPEKFDLYGYDVWRDEISETGQNYLNEPVKTKASIQGCYIATCVYGSYDCPQVWTLRRYRDYTLDKTWYGRAFIRTYYAISPKLVKLFGCTKWFNILWKKTLDNIINKLQINGYANTPYNDK